MKKSAKSTRSDKAFAILRIIFGLIWLVDASFKWMPAFREQFIGYFTESIEGQPELVGKWMQLWVSIATAHPQGFAYFVAITETLIAIALLFGIYTKLASYGGIIFTLALWSTAEGFGGPYTAGATDIGSAIIYTLVFAALILGESWKAYSFDKHFKLA